MNYVQMFGMLAAGLAIMGVVVSPIGWFAKWTVHKNWKGHRSFALYLAGSIIYFAALVTGLVALADTFGLVTH